MVVALDAVALSVEFSYRVTCIFHEHHVVVFNQHGT